jgi:hypothetical protein
VLPTDQEFDAQREHFYNVNYKLLCETREKVEPDKIGLAFLYFEAVEKSSLAELHETIAKAL